MPWTPEEKKAYFARYNKDYSSLFKKEKMDAEHRRELEQLAQKKEEYIRHNKFIFVGGSDHQGFIIADEGVIL